MNLTIIIVIKNLLRINYSFMYFEICLCKIDTKFIYLCMLLIYEFTEKNYIIFFLILIKKLK